MVCVVQRAPPVNTAMSTLQQPINAPWYVFFRRGLLPISLTRKPFYFLSVFSQ